MSGKKPTAKKSTKRKTEEDEDDETAKKAKAKVKQSTKVAKPTKSKNEVEEDEDEEEESDNGKKEAKKNIPKVKVKVEPTFKTPRHLPPQNSGVQTDPEIHTSHTQTDSTARSTRKRPAPKKPTSSPCSCCRPGCTDCIATMEAAMKQEKKRKKEEKKSERQQGAPQKPPRPLHGPSTSKQAKQEPSTSKHRRASTKISPRSPHAEKAVSTKGKVIQKRKSHKSEETIFEYTDGDITVIILDDGL
ncbi:hypothetical protein CAPTEDRAFT_201529 [Capitella teleta]|uniref:Uncharacterized protein n=1 Tax=Capitella teleta TaxID=283909 RepID=R7UM60_CAPTE|nr:hypothetical protein CAPTEDRAFT_201529 [Capitella teleta]|eukprot:ELU07594.1 hypothetical protein CAPTEDRAFT_201529 [Capitella teleta]